MSVDFPASNTFNLKKLTRLPVSLFLLFLHHLLPVRTGNSKTTVLIIEWFGEGLITVKTSTKCKMAKTRFKRR